MIKQISGSFSFHEYGLSAPSNLVLQLSEDAIIDISKKNIMSYDFVLKSSALNNISGCNRLLDVFTMGMGFLLDVPIYFSYFADFKEVSNLFDTGMLKENIEFERIKYDFKRSTDNEVKIVETNSEAITLLRIEIEQFIAGIIV